MHNAYFSGIEWYERVVSAIRDIRDMLEALYYFTDTRKVSSDIKATVKSSKCIS